MTIKTDNTPADKHNTDKHDTTNRPPIGKPDNTDSKKINSDDGADTNSE